MGKLLDKIVIKKIIVMIIIGDYLAQLWNYAL